MNSMSYEDIKRGVEDSVDFLIPANLNNFDSYFDLKVSLEDHFHKVFMEDDDLKQMADEIILSKLINFIYDNGSFDSGLNLQNL